jgi:hypothetical protein
MPHLAEHLIHTRSRLIRYESSLPMKTALTSYQMPEIFLHHYLFTRFFNFLSTWPSEQRRNSYVEHRYDAECLAVLDMSSLGVDVAYYIHSIGKLVRGSMSLVEAII